MKRYQLAKLVEWAGTLESRKRLQKVVYLLQANGCPLDADFTLHHYGPYSHDVAQLTDAMVQAELLEETATPNAMGRTFAYRLSDRAREQLGELDQSLDRQVGAFGSWETLAKRLLDEGDLKKLEYAATVAYFRKQGVDWRDARAAAAKFKHQQADSRAMDAAEALAREVLEPQGSN